jgi:hypothetical protein
MIAKWFPWKWMITRAARSYGLLDPFTFLARLRKFAEPSEVDFPLELMRAWTVFQARGVVNTRAIQHNLDWVWPYWVERQFNPRDASFIPRSFSVSHINLTHRNWTAVCVPDADVYALVDPRGLVTPLHDGWSLDAWIVRGQTGLVPGRCADVRQTMRYGGELAIETDARGNGCRLASRAEMKRDEKNGLVLHIDWTAEADPSARLCVSLRPYNPEGIQFIDSVKSLAEKPGWLVNDTTPVWFDRDPERYASGTYETGDVFNRLQERDGKAVDCPVGMATAAALFPIGNDGTGRVSVTIPLDEMPGRAHNGYHDNRPHTSWPALDELSPRLELPDERLAYVYHAAVRTLLSLSAGEVFPGSYTYRRFWFRDACIMLNALLAINHDECCRRALEGSFLHRQTLRGFFQSQQGEWDSNGQVLWLAGQYVSMTGAALSPRVLASLRKGADWLCRKRLTDRSDPLHAGLLPPGFSAEHLGPNNYYYWDNFWGLAGLRTASELFRRCGDADYAETLKSSAEDYHRCILTSLGSLPAGRCGGALPAAPGRRMDGGAIGSIVADYPLQLFDPADPRIMKTVEFLLGNCMIDNGFFHDMTHSGINPYLTLYLAQVLLRAGDLRYIPLVRRVAELASPTGQWPEAVHPLTGGGCMGDGQHGWAAAEWVLMIRNLFIREEKDRLIIGSGLLPEWLKPGSSLCFGPTSTPFGRVTVRVETGRRAPHVEVRGAWRGAIPAIEVAVPGRPDCTVTLGDAA